MKKMMSLSMLAVAATCVTMPAADATVITLSGDLGNQSWTGAPQPLAVGGTVIETFSHTDATGTLTGEVHAENLGGAFNLTITNLVYEALADGAAPGAHSIELYVGQEFVAGPGTYTGEHEVAGTASLAAGQEASVNMQSTHQFSNMLPSIFDSATGPGAVVPLAAGPANSTFTTTSNIYSIETYLALTLSGGFATPSSITLPASAHASATLIPAPGAMGLLLCGGLLGTRRRRG